jgi:hypothetical protein
MEQEPQRDAAPAPNLMLNIGRLSKMSQTITDNLLLTFACLKKVGLECSNVGAGAASKYLSGARAA